MRKKGRKKGREIKKRSFILEGPKEEIKIGCRTLRTVTWMNKEFEEKRAEGKYIGSLKVLMNTPFVLCTKCMIFPAKAERKWIFPRNVPSLEKTPAIKSQHALRWYSKKIKHLRQMMG